MGFECFECSSAQKRLYMLREFSGKNTAYNLPHAMIIEGDLDKVRFQDAFYKLIERHEALRTAFQFNNGKVTQVVYEEVDFTISYSQAEGLEIDDLIYEFIKPFDLTKAPLMRAELIKLIDCKYLFLFDIDHIITDGFSNGIIINELIQLYLNKNLPEVEIQYVDFAIWQNDLLNSELIQEQENYWLKVFNGQLPVLNMLTDYHRPERMSYEGSNFHFELGEELALKVKEVARKQDMTVFMFLFAVYNVLLAKYSEQDDVIVGTPIAGRQHAELRNTVGFFVNTIAMRNTPAQDKSFSDFLLEVKENALNGYKNQDYQFETLIDQLNLKRDLSRNPLFDTMFVFQNINNYELMIEGLKFSPYQFETRTVQFDITLEGQEKKNKFSFNLQYATRLFKKETMEKFAEHFCNIIQEVVASPEMKIEEIEVISKEEKQQLLFDWNDTRADYPKGTTIHQLFEKQVTRTPDNIALVFKDKEMSYRELNERTNQLARVLREKGVKAETIVGMLVERSFEMVIGIIGILKAGGVYLPIDPNYPEDRIVYTLKDSRTQFLLTQNHLAGQNHFSGEIIDLMDEKMFAEDCSNLENINQSSDLAYIIYTSGSTGKPKGVMVEHNNLIRLMFNDKFQFDFTETDVWTLFHSYCFDFTVWEMYGSLLYGGKLIIISKLIAQNSQEFLTILLKEKVTILNQTPTAFYNLIAEELKCNKKELAIRYVIFGGEALKPIMLKDWNQKYPETRLINMYGITETTVHVTYKEITAYEIENNISNIGKPIPTLTTYIMNQDQKLVPIGVQGELCVGGDGVARGYLNRPELTEEKFVYNPYFPEERMYRSGDLGRRLPNGDMEYLGRIDRQVKIRGFRIELGEIEKRLLQHEVIKDVVVIDQKDQSGNNYLAAYIISDQQPRIADLRSYLAKELPDYMIPSYFISLDQIPLTSNGKVDRKALPEPSGSISTGVKYVAPENETEENLVALWEEILGVEKIGINDDFFELGGHSLKAASLATKIYQDLNVEISLGEIFKTPTVRELAEFIRRTDESIYSYIEVVEEKEDAYTSTYPVSSAQKRLYVLNQLEGQGITYNMPGFLVIEGELDQDRFVSVFRKLIGRHESLRTSFELIDGEPVQRIHKDVDFNLIYLTTAEKELDRMIDEFIQPFDLSKAPLLRVGLVKYSDKHLLLIDLHHIISDGLSMEIFIHDFIQSYAGNELPELRIQYKDFSEWQNKFFESDEIKKKEKYWLETFAGDIPVLNLPTDYLRPVEMTFAGVSYNFTLSNELTAKVNQLATQNGATLYMVLLASYNILLSKYTGQEDIVVGSPISGRFQGDLDNVIGMFVNTLALRNLPTGEKNVLQFLTEVKENALKAYEHQDYQFEMLVEKLDLERDLNRNPLFDTMFVLQNSDSSELMVSDLKLHPYEFKNRIAKFDLTLNAVKTDEGIQCSLEYRTKLFKKETIERFAGHLENVIYQVVEEPELAVSDIEIISEEEKEQLLFEWNNTRGDYPEKQTISQLFEEQVCKTPNQIAVVFAKEQITYEKLNAKANQLARFLREKGVQSNQIVGIMAERSLEMFIGIMAILKAGGAYLSIDPTYPAERINYMLNDSQTNLLLTQHHLKGQIPFLGEIVDLEEEKLFTGDTSNLELSNNASDLAYVIYTSGSTGKPKGVLLEHIGIANLSQFFKESLGVNAEDRIVQFATCAFDASVWETYMALLSGATLYLITKDTINDHERFENFLNTSGITIATLPPIFLTNLRPKKVASLRKIVTAGSATNFVLVNRWKESVEYINAYGPTETTICASAWKCQEDESTYRTVPIGNPILNTQVYILNKNNHLVPPGVVGELCVSGVTLARGYLNRPELTGEKFVTNPYTKERMYRTGDLARWLGDSNIEFVGRMDTQVKVRGYRIEIGEIENQLLRHDAVNEVVVVARSDQEENKYLAAYFVSDGELKVAELRSFLSKELPDYMIPTYFVSLEKMPLTSNGKIDQKALPEVVESMMIEVVYVAPESEVEKTLAQIWSDVLGVSTIGINDNFFALGGDSIKAMQILARANEYGLNIPVKEIFKHKTIAQILKNVDYNKEKIVISQAEVSGEVLLTPIQRWFFEHQFSHQHYWNQLNLFSLREDVDVKLLEDVFKKIIEHHDALRMGYNFENGQVQQFNLRFDEVDFELGLIELAWDSYEVQKEKIIKISEEIQDQLNLETDLMIKAVLFDLGDNGKRLLIIVHHLVIDGVSWRILLEDLENQYRSKLQDKLPFKTTSFLEWGHQLNHFAETEILDIAYWEKINPVQVKSLSKMEVEENHSRDFKGVTVQVDQDLTEKLLTKVNLAYNTEINDILLTALTLSMTELMNCNNILLTLEGHGREEIIDELDLSRTIGWFTSEYPVYLEKQTTIEKTIKSVKETLRRIPNKGLNYGISRYLQGNEKLQRLNPEISFNYFGQLDGVIEKTEESLLSNCSENPGRSIHYDNSHISLIEINGMILNGKLELRVDYNAKYVEEGLIEKLKIIYLEQLSELITHCTSRIDQNVTASDYGVENLFDIDGFDLLFHSYEDVNTILRINALTPMQEGMLFHSLLNEEGTNYREQTCFWLEGKIDINLFKAAWEEVMERHEIFRTDFKWKEAKSPVQIVLEEKEVEIYEIDISELNIDEQSNYINNFKDTDLNRPFDFKMSKLNRLSLLKLSAEKYFICWTFHHILMDGWSGPVVIKNLLQIYYSLLNQLELPVIPVAQFGDYLEWLKKQNRRIGLQFWQEYLKDFAEPTLLPVDKRKRRGESITESRTMEIGLDQVKTAEINEFCKKNEITINVLIQTAWGILLQKYNNTEQSCFGMTVSGRPGEVEDVENIVGLFINTLPILFNNITNINIREILNNVNNKLVEIREHDYISLVDIEHLSNIDKSQPLFNTIIVYENYPIGSMEYGNVGFEINFDSVYSLTNYDITILVASHEKTSFKFTYNVDLFEDDEIERISKHFINILNVMIQNIELSISEIEMIGEEEKQKLLSEFNDTTIEYAKEKTIHQLFEEQVERTPDHQAIVCTDEQLNFSELNDRANQLAEILIKKGIQKDITVGIMVDRSVEMVVGILGILKAGGAYLPIDPEYPAERMKYMLQDSGTKILVTQSRLQKDLEIEKLDLDTFTYNGESTNPERAVANNLAYIIYTSGSTGKPKGVAIEHQSIANYMNWFTKQGKITKADSSVMLSSYAFDLGYTAFWSSLLSGATLHIVAESLYKDGNLLVDYLGENSITFIKVTPSMFNMMINSPNFMVDDELQSLRIIVLGGEKIRVNDLEVYQSKYPKIQFMNHYGPTEATIGCLSILFDQNDINDFVKRPVIGRPINNMKVYIVDRNDQIQPIGVIGELCLSGVGLARGYLNRPELTEERFIANPFITLNESESLGERLYKTGDLARWLSDGKVEFIGRIDHQIKIRGFRVEVGEIEKQLLTHPNILEAVVSVGEDEACAQYLCAYIVSDSELTVSKLRNYLSKELPDYMIPSYFVQLDELPLTPNGKLDRKALPNPQSKINIETVYVAPTNLVEAKLVEIWSDILGVEKIGIYDNFFDLGGHSLRATQFTARVFKEMNVEIPLREVFEKPTIRELAEDIKNIEQSSYISIEKT
ncbi:MAG: amino acid adenylation domain-containing protein, partial [Halanaerobiales bacterium]|nr:amino acid adenylation domain-containing protein [Halanaerobiales bacterium]